MMQTLAYASPLIGLLALGFAFIKSNKVNAADAKTRKARPIKNFKQSIDVNKKLSELAFAYV